MLQRPESHEYAPFFADYISTVPNEEIFTFLQRQGEEIAALFAQVTEEQSSHRYAEGKWSLKEVLGHITDTERVMSYRLMRIARGDTTPLPGFDQDVLIENGSLSEFKLTTLLAEFQAVRQASICLLYTIPASAWLRTGNVSGRDVTARSLAYIIAGHSQHHLHIVKERYI